MKLVIIRHGEPDYVTDSLLPHGREEATALAEVLSDLPITAIYSSPLGRAKQTCEIYCEKNGHSFTVKEWLREFHAPVSPKEGMGLPAWDAIYNPEEPTPHIPWDMKPSFWVNEPRFYDRELWKEVPLMKTGNVGEEYERVTKLFDGLLSEHGYTREKNLYRAVSPNHDTIVLFCHLGVECVLLSHLTGISPVLLWHHTAARTTSYTTVVTEERERGIATWRMLGYGEISHLREKNIEPSFICRFCECFDDDTRH